MKKFKKGDKVWAFRNASWGLKPMVITNNIKKYDVYITCKHPKFGIGGFLVSDLKLDKNIGKHRELCKQLEQLRKKASRLEKRIFGR